MITTESQAKRKWCARWTSEVEACMPKCEASECMAWRWSKTYIPVAPPSECPSCRGESKDCSECDGTGKIGHYEHGGYCGLAGKPEVDA